jgi:hypothetical protein
VLAEAEPDIIILSGPWNMVPSNMVPPWAHAIGAKINIARRAVVARNIALFIRSSLSWHVSLATITSKHATQRSPALI